MYCYRFGVALLAMVLAAVPAFPSTPCFEKPECAPPAPNQVLFLGEVVGHGAPLSGEEGLIRPIRFRVLERFHGLDGDVGEVEIPRGSAHSYAVGSRWLVDAERRIADGRETIEIPVCRGKTSPLSRPDQEINAARAEHLLRYLRARFGRPFCGTKPSTSAGSRS